MVGSARRPGEDGDDRTSPALIRMLLNGEDGEGWNRLKVQPVSLSYEWDPCDGMKVRELLIRDANNGEYVKASGEDERSMKQGLFGWKGRIHVAFCDPVAWEHRRRAFVPLPTWRRRWTKFCTNP